MSHIIYCMFKSNIIVYEFRVMHNWFIFSVIGVLAQNNCIYTRWLIYDGKMVEQNVACQGWDFQGGVSIRKTVLPGMTIPMLKIRRPNGRLIFNMEIAIRR